MKYSRPSTFTAKQAPSVCSSQTISYKSFRQPHPDANKGRWSQQELNQKSNTFIQNRNRKPVVAFEGLSAKQIPLLAFSRLGFGLQSKPDSDGVARLVFRDLQLVIFGEIQFKTLSGVGQTDARIVVVL